MRKVVVSMIASVDGFHEGPGKDVSAMPFDDAFSPHNAELLRTAGILLLGRVTFEGFRSYWPSVADDETAPALEREISRLDTALPKIVVSDTLDLDPRAPWSSTTTVVRRADAAAAIEAAKRDGEGDIVVFGSATMWNALLEQGLVDQLQILVGPAVLGSGSRLYSGASRVPLKLVDAARLPDSQLVRLTYVPAQQPRAV